MSQSQNEGVRRPVLYAAVFLVVAVAGAVAFKKMRSTPPVTPPTEQTETTARTPATSPKPVHASAAPEPDTTAEPAPGAPAISASTPKTNAPRASVNVLGAPRTEPSAETRSLVSALANIDLNSTPLTPEAAAAWKENLARLVQNGSGSVPAIQEFLALNKDVSFDTVTGAKGLLGASTLRLSLLDALGNINSPDALALSSQMLQSTLDPREIALLAQNLDRQAPEQYREAALAAARAAMAEAPAGRLGGKDIGPLFDVLRNYGGAAAVQDFQQAAAGPWKYYATIALADLPEAAGVPTLVQMVSDPKNPAIGGRVAALQVLAQMMPDNPQAREAVIAAIRQGTIPEATMINIAASAAGDKFQIGTSPVENNPNLRSWHLSYGNQNYYSTPQNLTADQLHQRAALVEELFAARNQLIGQSGSAAEQFAIGNNALQDARNRIMARLAALGPQQ